MSFKVKSTIPARDQPSVNAAILGGVMIGTELAVDGRVEYPGNMVSDIWIRSGSGWFAVRLNGFEYGELS
jgi:hypothetical protein